MSWTDVSSVVFAGVQTVAVAAGLVFVNVQLRDSRRMAKGSAYQSWLDTILAFFMSLADNEGLSQLYWKGRKDITTLNEAEVSQFFYLCVTYFTLIENLYVQYDQGLIPKSVFLPWQYGFADGLKGSGFMEYWRLESDHYAPTFKRFVNQLLYDQDGSPGDTKLSAFWSLVDTSFGNERGQQEQRAEVGTSEDPTSSSTSIEAIGEA